MSNMCRECKKQQAAAVADAIREAAGLFTVGKHGSRIVCAECGSDNTEIGNTDDLPDGGVDFYQCGHCGHHGEAVYVTIYTDMT